ncbi:uncharacterized protein JCM10292_001380 [Rhodotorula paludigena]|uniref:uncharacterized protein n=1 Tax=Rhodotorula paludigena TaxID=86838 RepID=UPI00317A2EEE
MAPGQVAGSMHGARGTSYSVPQQDQILNVFALPAPLAADLQPFKFWRHIIRNFRFHKGSWIPINTFFHEECKRLFPQATALVATPTRMLNTSSTPSFNLALSYDCQIVKRGIETGVVHVQLVTDSDMFDSLLLSVFDLGVNVWILGRIMRNLRHSGSGKTKHCTTNEFYRGAKQMLVAVLPTAAAGALTRTPTQVRPSYIAQPKPYPPPDNLLLKNFAVPVRSYVHLQHVRHLNVLLTGEAAFPRETWLHYKCMQPVIRHGSLPPQIPMFIPNMRTAGLLLAQLGELVALAQQEYGSTPSTVADKGYFVFGLPFCETKPELCCLNYTTLDHVTYLSFKEILDFWQAQRRQDKVPNKDCFVNQGMLQLTAALARAHAKMLGWPTDALVKCAHNLVRILRCLVGATL